MPKVSVIVPAYNCSKFISKTIESVRAQTHKDWELLLVDDGSSDDTQEVVLAIQKKDPRILYIYQANSGASANPKNTGIKKSSGEYIAFLDHDDEWVPEKLEKSVSRFASLRHKNVGLIASNAMVVNLATGARQEHKMPYTDTPTPLLLERNFIFCSSGVVVRRDALLNTGFFDEQFKFGDDWDLWLRISVRYDFDFIHEPLYNFNRHEKTVTNNIKSTVKIKDYEYGLSKHITLYKKYPKQLSSRLLTMGRICYIAGEKKKGILFFSQAVFTTPFNGRAYINLFFALLGPYFYRAFITERTKNHNTLKMQKIINVIKEEIKTLRSIIRAKAFVGKHAQKDIVDQFHKLYYSTALIGGTYKNTTFLGIPTRKCPLDTWAYQEIIFEKKPDVIIECGTSHGGSALYLASICDLIGKGEIVTIDIEDLPRPQHKRIKYLLGSSTSSEIFNKVKELIKGKEKVMLILDSDHSRDHVLKELQMYNSLVTAGQFMIVEDTNVNGHPVYLEHGPGPWEALDEFLKTNNDFKKSDMDSKFLLSFNPRGYWIKK